MPSPNDGSESMKADRKYCDATTKRSKAPCRNPAGFRTSHSGSGRCFLHAGRSTGAKTAAGKAITGQNNRKHGLYSKILTGEDAARFAAVSELDPGFILKENFYLVQARLLGLLGGEGKFSREARVLLSACDLLIEQEELSAEFVQELRLRLLNIDIERMTRIMNGTVGLAQSGIFLDRMGDARKQLEIARRFIVNVLRNCNDRDARAMAISAISEMKLEAGLPVEEIEALLAEIEEDSTEENSAEPEGDRAEITSSSAESVESGDVEGDIWG